MVRQSGRRDARFRRGGSDRLGARPRHRPSIRSRRRAPAFRTSSTQEISQAILRDRVRGHGPHREVDGRVSENEIRVARGIMRGMNLSDPQVREAIDCFTRGKERRISAGRAIRAARPPWSAAASSARAFVQIQLQSAIGAGRSDASKRQLLWRVASALDVERAEVAQLEALVRAYEQRGARQPEGGRETSTTRIACSAWPATASDERSEDGVSPPDEPVPSGQDRRARLAAVDGRGWRSKRRTRSARPTRKSRRARLQIGARSGAKETGAARRRIPNLRASARGFLLAGRRRLSPCGLSAARGGR